MTKHKTLSGTLRCPLVEDEAGGYCVGSI
jgi:hypothetical protein